MASDKQRKKVADTISGGLTKNATQKMIEQKKKKKKRLDEIMRGAKGM